MINTHQHRLYRFTRTGDTGWTIPSDGNRYYMVRHEIDFLGKTRHADNGADYPVPAVANAKWGRKSLNNQDYTPLPDPWHLFIYRLIDHFTGGLLQPGRHIGYFEIENNPKKLFHLFSPGSIRLIYAMMFQDAAWATDASNITDGARDVALGLNLKSTFLWSYLIGTTTGALLKLKYENGGDLWFSCLDSNKPPPNPRNLDPWEYYFPTQVHVGGRVTRFPHFSERFEEHGWNYPIGTVAPVIAPGGVFRMYKSAVQRLNPGDVWTPYYS